MPPAPVTVRVSLTCNNQRIQIRVSPWRARITKPGQGIVWRPSKSIAKVGISKEKPKAGWPYKVFVSSGNAAHPPKGRKLKPGTKGKRYPYRITLRFKDPLGRQRRAVIDPDMVVET
jgi:hypothetical protein